MLADQYWKISSVCGSHPSYIHSSPVLFLSVSLQHLHCFLDVICSCSPVEAVCNKQGFSWRLFSNFPLLKNLVAVSFASGRALEQPLNQLCCSFAELVFHFVLSDSLAGVVVGLGRMWRHETICCMRLEKRVSVGALKPTGTSVITVQFGDLAQGQKHGQQLQLQQWLDA